MSTQLSHSHFCSCSRAASHSLSLHSLRLLLRRLHTTHTQGRQRPLEHFEMVMGADGKKRELLLELDETRDRQRFERYPTRIRFVLCVQRLFSFVGVSFAGLLFVFV